MCELLRQNFRQLKVAADQTAVMRRKSLSQVIESQLHKITTRLLDLCLYMLDCGLRE